MNIDQLTNKDDYSIPNTPTNIIELSSEDELNIEKTSPPKSPIKAQVVKRQTKPKRKLYYYRKDPRYRGQPLEFDIPLTNEGGTLVNYSELVKKYLDEQEANNQGTEEFTESESQLSEAMVSGSHSEDEISEDFAENLDGSAATLKEGDIQDKVLKGFLRRADAYGRAADSEEDLSDIGEYDYQDKFIDDSELLNAPKKKQPTKSRRKSVKKAQIGLSSESEGETSFDEFGKDPRGISRFFVHFGPLPDAPESKPTPSKPKSKAKSSTGLKSPKKQNTSTASSLQGSTKKPAAKKTPKKDLALNATKKPVNLLKPTAQPQVRRELDINNFTSEDSELSLSSLSSASDLEHTRSGSLQNNAPRPLLSSPTHREHVYPRPPLKFLPKPNEKPHAKDPTPLKPFTSKFNVKSASKTPPATKEVSDGPLKKILNSPAASYNNQAAQVKPKRRKILTPNSKLRKAWYRNLPIPSDLDAGPESSDFASNLEKLFLNLKQTILSDMVKCGPVPVTVKTLTLDLIRLHLKFNLTSSGAPPINFIQRLSAIYDQDRVYIMKLINKMFLADQLTQRLREKEYEMRVLKLAIARKCPDPLDLPKKFLWTPSLRDQICRLVQLEKACFHLTVKKLSAEGKADETLSEDLCISNLCDEITSLFPKGYNVSIKRMLAANLSVFAPLEPDFSLEDFFCSRSQQTPDMPSSHDPARVASYRDHNGSHTPSHGSANLSSINLPDPRPL